MIIFASDFDGTMHFRDSRGWGYIPKQNIAAIHAFRQAGNLFGFCTGRPLEGLLRDLNESVEADFIISSTGSVITKGKKMDSLLYMKEIDSSVLRSLTERFSKEYDLVFHAIKKVYTVEKVNVAYREQNAVSPDELYHHKINGISVFAGNAERAQKLTETINHDYDSIQAFQNRDWLDIVAGGVSKGNALLKVKELFHGGSCAAIGDAENDISMLKSADVSFTFHSSIPLVQKEADYLVDDVAQAVEILLNNEKNNS